MPKDHLFGWYDSNLSESFFFSSRRRHTIFDCDWSSDVCSSDLRREDIPDLVTAILRRHDGGAQPVRLSSEALQVLTRGAWPQNVRQLENAVRAALSNRSGPEIGITDLPCDVRRQATRRTLSPMEQAELDAIMTALEHA